MNKDKFIDFLIENDIFDKYVTNTETHWDGGFKDVDEFLNKRSPTTYITAAFRWLTTPEGYEYWKVINTTWREKL